jgi:uncharacterized protein YxeA
MKKSIIAFGTLFFLAIGIANAQTEKDQEDMDNPAIEQEVVQERTEIEQKDLPKMVKNTLKSEKFNGWKVDKAYKMKDGREMVYEVELMNEKMEEKKATYKFNEDGEVIS